MIKLNRDKVLNIMIRMMVKNYSKLKENILFIKLADILATHFNNNKFDIKHYFSEAYWKYPDLVECIFLVTIKDLVQIKDFIKIFKNITWSYSENRCYDIDDPLKIPYLWESAIWSQNKNQQEIFLNSDVEWVEVSNSK